MEAMADDVQSVDPIVVTARPPFSAAAPGAPQQVLEADDLRRMGYANVGEALLGLSANGMGTLSQANPGADAAGAGGVALRGLTIGATLVLIDGQRMAPYPLPDDGQRDFVDVANLPLAAVERIEVYKDGASALYGAEAMAGVVNVVLRRRFSGTGASASAGVSSRHDGASRTVSLLHGWDDEGAQAANTYFALDLSRQDAILLSQRPALGRTDWTSLGGQNVTLGVPNAVNGGIPSDSGTGFLLKPSTGEPGAFFGNCNTARFLQGACGYSNPYLQVQPQTEHADVLVRHSRSLSNEWNLDVQGSLFRSTATQVGTFNSLEGGNGIANLAFEPGHAPAPVNATAFPDVITVPGSYPGNPYGRAAALVYDFPDVGATATYTDARAIRLVASLQRDTEAWHLRADAGFTRVLVDVSEMSFLSLARTQAALDNGSYLVGSQDNSASVLAVIAPPASICSTDELDFADLQATFKLGSLGGEPTDLRLGAEARERRLDDAMPPSFASGDQISPIYAFAVGSQQATSAYAQWGAQPLPQLAAEAAARLEHEAGYGVSAVPRIRAQYRPSGGFALHATYSQGYRPPNPREAGDSGSEVGVPNPVYDPVLCPGGANPSGANVNCVVFPDEVQLPGRKLRAERSDAVGAGVALGAAEPASLSLDYYRIDVHNLIVSPGLFGQQQIDDPSGFGSTIYRDPTTGRIAYETFPFINAGAERTAGIDALGRARLAISPSDALEASLQWTRLLRFDLTLGGQVYALAGTHGPSFVSGDTGTPRERGTASLGWRRGADVVELSWNHVGSFSVTDPSLGATSCARALAAIFNGNTPPGSACTVGAFDTFNLEGEVVLGHALRLRLGIENLFDRGPPLDLQTVGAAGNGAPAAGAAYNPALHQAGAVGRYFSVGISFSS